MHVCIVGTGASGWLACHFLKSLSFIDKITIVGSPAIPTIGVGESTTYNFIKLLHSIFDNEEEYWKFIYDIDGAVKYGVSYQGWSKNKFLHAFVGDKQNNLYGHLLGQIPESESADDYMMPYSKEIYNNYFCADTTAQMYSFHFDANKLIAALEELAKKDKKITHIKETVVDSDIKERVNKIVLKDKTTIEADYFISCIGQTAFNQKIFKEEYQSYSDVLLTDKALFYPLKYKNKRQEFHPYTIAKTMKNGWRWITPTWNRIGTGYVFSSNHISIDEATKELQDDIGDPNIEPFVADFYPRKSKNPYKVNSCTLGMAAGFLEPLDAPGLNILMSFFDNLKNILQLYKNANFQNNNEYSCYVEITNIDYSQNLDWWASFILHQYKTSTRNDTQFWKDHKSVKFDHYENIIANLFDPLVMNNDLYYKDRNTFIFEPYMFYNTTAGKNIPWTVKSDLRLTKYTKEDHNFENHYDFFSRLHKHFGKNNDKDYS